MLRGNSRQKGGVIQTDPPPFYYICIREKYNEVEEKGYGVAHVAGNDISDRCFFGVDGSCVCYTDL